MARYPSKTYRRRKKRRRRLRWVYSIAALAVVAVAIALICRGCSSAENQDKTYVASISDNADNEISGSKAPEPILPEVSYEPVAEPNSKAAQLIDEAVKCIEARPARNIEARDRLSELLPMAISGRQRAFVKEQLSQLADDWLFSRTILPQDRLCGYYKVRRGDLLSKIADRHKVPYEILMEINGIHSPESLQAGHTIKVINGPFHARIYRSTFTMDLYLQDTFVRSFSVGLGRQGKETPTGLWLVRPAGKLIKPTWTDPVSGKTYHAEDPDYPLGSRWIGLRGVKGAAKDRTGFAIHGTKDPGQIGTARSQGCIRLHNGDAILVYNLLMPGFSQVEVVE